MKDIYLKYKTIINYIIFGVFTTVISFITYLICVNTFLNPYNKVQLQIANVISWIVGVAFAYITNRKYVFESKEIKKIKEACKFFTSRIITLLIDMFIMYIGVTVCFGNDKLIKIISQIVVIICNYLFSKLIVFKTKKSQSYD